MHRIVLKFFHEYNASFAPKHFELILYIKGDGVFVLFNGTYCYDFSTLSSKNKLQKT